MCNEGRGTALVLAVGENTYVEQLMSKFTVEPDEVPESELQKNLTIVQRNLSMIGYLIAFLTMLALIMQAIFGVSVDKKKDFDLDWTCDLVDAPIIALILIILVGSNGVYLVVSVSFAKSMSSLFQHMVMVPKFQDIELLAYCNEIVTDKTGCLT